MSNFQASVTQQSDIMDRHWLVWPRLKTGAILYIFNREAIPVSPASPGHHSHPWQGMWVDFETSLVSVTQTNENMKNAPFVALCLFCTLAGGLTAPLDFVSGQEAKGKEFIVMPGGSDNNPGTPARPMASLEAARDAARAAGTGNHRIVMLPGEYYRTRPFELDWRDNGLTIEADTNGKVILYGGTPVTGWQNDGERFWSLDVQGVKEGTLDIRSLVVNGRMPPRAQMPESGTFEYLNRFDAPWLSSVGGGWAHYPTQEELTFLRYDPKDVPASLDLNSAEIRVYHSWDESLLKVARNDAQRHELILAEPPIYPPGAFGTKSYVVCNTREGMAHPGQWYLDHTRGKLVYWPLEGEDMATAKVIVPGIEQIISIAGNPDRKAERITIRGLALQATNIPFQPAGMNAVSFSGGLNLVNADQCTIEDIEICNVAGVGISAAQLTNCRITGCHIHHTGGGGAKVYGTDIFFTHNHIHNTGIHYPGAVGLHSSGSRNRICYNEVHDIPYSGMNVGRTDLLLEGNLIYRVMREINDGAAIYTFGAENCIIRNNVIRDIKSVGEGTGAFGYYLDEGSHDCIIEKNIAVNVESPILNHIARNSIIRDNVFISDADMTLSFPLSWQITFENNKIVTPGSVKISSPHAISVWENNQLFTGGRLENNQPQVFKIDSVKPANPVPRHKTEPVDAVRTGTPPKIDGDIGRDEWTGAFYRLDRDLSGQLFTGGSTWIRLAWDNKCLYVGVMVIMFDNKNIRTGDTWKKDDGVEISLVGFDKGKPSTYVIRSYVNGAVQSVADAGAPALPAERLEKEIRYASKITEDRSNGWTGEWAIPWPALGIKPGADMKVPFNICSYVNEYGKWHCWEGTLGESGQAGQAGMLRLK